MTAVRDIRANSSGPAPVIEVAVAGGLGNQMFQYAAGRALALETGADLVLDTAFFRRGRHRAFELDAFPGPRDHARILKPTAFDRLKRSLGLARGLPVWREAGVAPDPGFHDLSPPLRIGGYFQSADHFARFAPTIRRELAPPPATDRQSLAVAEAIRDGAALHVRRGDYVSNPKAQALFATCLPDYYRAALDQLPEGTEVHVFSDDIGWAKQNLPKIRKLSFVGETGPRDGLADLWLMSLARHHIIANSSFSWWGAWLAGPGRGLTIAPLAWFRDPAIDDSRLIPDGWIRLGGQDVPAR